MGIYLADVFKLRAGTNEKAVVDLQARAADDVKFVLEHEIVNLVDGASRAVFQRNNAVLAKTLFDRREDGLKVREIQDVRSLKQLFTGQLGIRALHALAGDHRLGREEVGGGFNRGGNFLGKLRVVPEKAVLIRAAQRENERIQAPCAVFQIVGRHLGDRGQLLALAPRVQNGKIVFLFIGRNLSGACHPLGKELHELLIDFVDCFAGLL